MVRNARGMRQRALSRWLSAFVAASLLGVACALLVGVGLPQHADFTGRRIAGIGRVAPEVGSLAPPFERETLTGENISLFALRGQPVLINFWATWCGPCQYEMPELQSLYDDYADSGLRILAVNLGESRRQMAAWVQDFGLTFDMLPDSNRELEALYRVRGQPATVVVQPDGRISAIFYGATTAATLRDHLPFE